MNTAEIFLLSPNESFTKNKTLSKKGTKEHQYLSSIYCLVHNGRHIKIFIRGFVLMKYYCKKYINKKQKLFIYNVTAEL